MWPNLLDLATDSTTLARRADRACLQHDQALTLQTGDRRVDGICAGIADDGALVLRTERGAEKFYSGVLIHA